MATKSSTQEMESLVINKVASPAVYQSMVTNNQINENELYLVMGDETPEASSTTPAMDGTASAGSLTAYARGDHVHPTDTSRAAVPTTIPVTLTAAGWSSNAQTVTVTGVSATETAQLITITPAIASQSDYLDAGVKATSQAANSITFSCDTTPTVALTVYVTIQEVAYAS